MQLADLNIPTPMDSIHLEGAGVALTIKRDDLNHPRIQGNKWRKIKYNLQAYRDGDYERIISFGGVFSNHVYALAAATSVLNIPCTLYLRGYTLDEDNPTVQYLRSRNVEIKLLDHSTYRTISSTVFLASLKAEYPQAYIIPEGGTNREGIQGVTELGNEIIDQFSELPDYVCVSAGTGGTAAGLIQAFEKYKTKILVFSSLKGDFLRDEIAALSGSSDFELITDYHFNGYAKFSTELITFINMFKKEHAIALDPIYTAKMMYGVMDLVDQRYFPLGSKLLAIHTGGLQGIAGYNYRYASKYGKIM